MQYAAQTCCVCQQAVVQIIYNKETTKSGLWCFIKPLLDLRSWPQGTVPTTAYWPAKYLLLLHRMWWMSCPIKYVYAPLILFPRNLNSTARLLEPGHCFVNDSSGMISRFWVMSQPFPHMGVTLASRAITSEWKPNWLNGLCLTTTAQTALYLVWHHRWLLSSTLL